MTFDVCMILSMTAANVLRISILMIQFWCYQRTYDCSSRYYNHFSHEGQFSVSFIFLILREPFLLSFGL